MSRIDILVNNAGVYKPSRFVDYSPEVFDQILQVNLYGAFHVSCSWWSDRCWSRNPVGS